MEEVAITGAGIICPIGADIEAFWRALLEGRHGLVKIDPASGLGEDCYWAAVPDDHLRTQSLPPEFFRNADRFTQYAVVAAAQAIAMAGFDSPPVKTAVVMGNTMGGLPFFAQTEQHFTVSTRHVTPKLMALVIPNMAASRISLNWHLRGLQLTISTACASSLDAIGLAARMIERGEVSCAIAGGTETLLSPVVYASLARAGALSRAKDPTRASLPFDVRRKGFVMGDGGAVVLLESGAHARRRGAEIWGRVRGYASMTDAHHLTAPEPSGRYESDVMREALDDAGCRAGAVFAHATGTLVGDVAELRAINSVFSDPRLPVTSLKGHLGHAMAASGAMSTIAAVLGMHRGVIPHTLGTDAVEPEAKFDLVLHEPRELRYDSALVNAFGFGSQNASLVLSR